VITLVVVSNAFTLGNVIVNNITFYDFFAA